MAMIVRTPTRAITAADLRARDACADQLAEFKRLFPNGWRPASLDEAMADCQRVARTLNLGWAAWNLLSVSAWRAYRETVAPAELAYREAIAAAWRAYDEAADPAQRAYYEAVAAATRAYDEAAAESFARAFWADRTGDGRGVMLHEGDE